MRFFFGLISGFLTVISLYIINSASLMIAPPDSTHTAASDSVLSDPALHLQPMAQSPVSANTFVTVNRRALTPKVPETYDYSPSPTVTDAATSGRSGAVRWQAVLPAGDDPAPLVLLFAGTGRSPLSVLDMWLPTARQHDLALLAPDTRDDPQHFLSALKGDTFQQLIADISATRAIDPDRIYLFGHSQGGQVALTMANQIRGPWQAVATHAGHPQATMIRDAKHGPPLRLYLGGRDHIFNAAAAKEAGQRYARAGHRTELHLIPNHTHWFYEIGPKIADDTWKWFQAHSTAQ
ncbi:S9 family peptidase [Thalassobius sp. Cn5-15]|uniref:alpha/beta hydrolase family protein n=1 Tax=Thalassobius sp. Cn5-15 TaxID=2917763 RepID=UPI001EF1CCFF|nr:dienelactone hydrolase family protein [Thalassobius sp. Cn5-15]MCG7492192.1 dienelactone hydrolase family protein [Thalassobius sp. Cn5-15]